MASKGDFKVPTLCRPANIWHRNKRFSFTLLIAVSLVLSHLPVTDFSLSVFNILSLCLKFVFSSLTFSFCISLLLSGYKHIDFFFFFVAYRLLAFFCFNCSHYVLSNMVPCFSISYFPSLPSFFLRPHFLFCLPLTDFSLVFSSHALFELFNSFPSFFSPFRSPFSVSAPHIFSYILSNALLYFLSLSPRLMSYFFQPLTIFFIFAFTSHNFSLYLSHYSSTSSFQ